MAEEERMWVHPHLPHKHPGRAPPVLSARGAGGRGGGWHAAHPRPHANEGVTQ